MAVQRAVLTRRFEWPMRSPIETLGVSQIPDRHLNWSHIPQLRYECMTRVRGYSGIQTGWNLLLRVRGVS